MPRRAASREDRPITPTQIAAIEPGFPALKPLFARTDIRDQGRKLMQAIGFVVAHLRRPDAMLPAVAALGARHAAYGATPAHYETVGQALLGTLAEGLGPHFTEVVRDAWAAAYVLLAGHMIESAGEAREAA